MVSQTGPERRVDMAAQINTLDTRLTSLERAVAENTEITKDIRDAVVAGKFVAKLIKWTGALALAGSAIYAAVYQLLHDGKLPHQ